MKRIILVSTVCFGVIGLATADVVTATITPTINITHATLAFALDSSSLFGAGSLSFNYISLYSSSTDMLLAGVPVTISRTFNNVSALPVVNYTVLSTYDDGTLFGGSVAFNPVSASSFISSSTPWPFDPPISERWYEASFANNNADTWDRVFRSMISNGWAPVTGGDAGIVNFSDATNGGTVTHVSFSVNPPPVPAPAATLVFAAGMLARRRQKAR